MTDHPGATEGPHPETRSIPLVDVVILTFNDGQLLDGAVASALDSCGVEVRVWVIDNASDPPATVCDDERVHLTRNETNRGVGGGRNQGVALGTSEIVCVLDSDAQLRDRTLSQLVRPLEQDSVGIAVPMFSKQLATQSAGRAPTILVKLQRGLNLRDTYAEMPNTGRSPWWEVDFGIGACQVFRRECFELVGGYDESDPFGPEDLDFCLRVGRSGWNVVQVAETDVVHPPRRGHRSLLSRRGLRHARSIARHFYRQARGMAGPPMDQRTP